MMSQQRRRPWKESDHVPQHPIGQRDHRAAVETVPSRRASSHRRGRLPPMRLDPILTQLDAAIEAQLRLADPAVAEAAAGFLEAFRPSVRAAMLEVVQQAAAEIGAQLGDQRVEVRLVDGDPELVVASQPATGLGTEEDEDFEARITLRLPTSLKDLIEDAASSSGDSINRWVVETLRSRAGRSKAGSRVQETFEL